MNLSLIIALININVVGMVNTFPSSIFNGA